MRVLVVGMAAALVLSGCVMPSAMPRNELLSKPTQELCELYRVDPGQNIMSVILERDKFSDDEIGLIRRKQVRVGMSEEALRCAWGVPGIYGSINQSAGRWGSRKQYVYRRCSTCRPQYVYVEKGKVTGFQSP